MRAANKYHILDDAYSLFKWFHPGSQKQLLNELYLYTSVQVPINVNLLALSNRINMKHFHTTLPHPLYDKNSATCVATNASRACSVCKSLCKNYCSVCSEMENDNIVALCGLKSKQGSACIVKHI